MSRCRWDHAQGVYLHDGEPCRTDEYGDPTVHCTARRSCANHVGRGELTCARCIARTRADLGRIVALEPLLTTAALAAGVNSEAANLAGPATDAEAWSWHKVSAKQGRYWHASLIEDDDEHHPYAVLTRWEFMLREDYEQPRSDETSTCRARAYLDLVLHRLAQDHAQDWTLFAREIRACREHLEAVLGNSLKPETGAPCPDCKAAGHVVPMRREYPHWCEADDCERFHYADESYDRWVCPRDRDHWRTHEDYSRWVEERRMMA
jgi:hypothetical protein